MGKYEIDFEPIGRRGKFTAETSLLDCARQLSVDLISICGGTGSCGWCKVQVVSGQVSPHAKREQEILSTRELELGYRLACMTYPLSNVKLSIPPESLSAPQRTQVEGLDVSVDPDPPVQLVDAHLSQPTVNSPKADARSLWLALKTQGIGEGRIDYQVLKTLSSQIREYGWHVHAAVRGNEIIAISGPSTQNLGLAIDIGTTKIAGYLVNIQTGTTLASKGMMNPQISYGEDVISRIVAANKSSEDATKLQSLLVETLNQLAENLCEEINAAPEQILEVVVVGNTAMHHIFLGLPVRQLGLSPYVPAVVSKLDIKAREIGLKIAPGGYIHILPNIAGYVGADHVAMLLATRMHEFDDTTLAIDIGTNTEICLTNGGRMISASCASGPAFEGAHIKFGMRAAPGAIEHVRLQDDRLEIQTIDGQPPIGICGSGLLDVVAQLRLNGIVESNGKLSSHPLVQIQDDKPVFVVAQRPELDPITVSQKDVRELQLAKAAIRLGIKALLEAEGVDENEIKQIIIAGAFGTFLDVQSAIAIGMLPNLPLERFRQVGNAAGTGARLVLISQSERKKSLEIARRVEYIELAKVSNFDRKFAEATYL